VLFTVFICLVLTGVGFVKQPLPSFLDPKRGFGARGEGTLTSQLIVMKNINKELIKYQDYILDLYEKVKQRNKPDFDMSQPYQNDSLYDYDLNQNYDYDDDYQNFENKNKTSDLSDYYQDKELNGNQDSKKKNKKIRFKRDLDQKYEISLSHNATTEYDVRFLNDRIFKSLTGNDIIKMMHLNLSLPLVNKMKFDRNGGYEKQFIQKKFNFKPIESCDITLGLNKNLEFYFRASDESESHAHKAQEHYNRNSSKTSKSLNKYFNDIDTDYSIHLDQFFNHNVST